MGITVENFIKVYKANLKAKDKTFEDFIKKHITVQYVKFLEKNVWCDSIISSTCYTTVGDKKIIKMNSVARHICFTMRIIDLYTDIDIVFEGTKFLEQYDELNEIGAIEVLIGAIPETELEEFNILLNMKLNDLRDNEYSITALLYNLKNSLDISEEIIESAIKEILEDSELPTA